MQTSTIYRLSSHWDRVHVLQYWKDHKTVVNYFLFLQFLLSEGKFNHLQLTFLIQEDKISQQQYSLNTKYSISMKTARHLWYFNFINSLWALVTSSNLAEGLFMQHLNVSHVYSCSLCERLQMSKNKCTTWKAFCIETLQQLLWDLWHIVLMDLKPTRKAPHAVGHVTMVIKWYCTGSFHTKFCFLTEV